MCVEVSKLLLSKISTNIKSNTKCKCKVKYILINKISTIVKLSLPSLSSPLSLSTTTHAFLYSLLLIVALVSSKSAWEAEALLTVPVVVLSPLSLHHQLRLSKHYF